jgi:DNA/RNA-binding protein KIN17
LQGWFVQWIDRDPETIARQKKIDKMEAAQRDEEERQGLFGSANTDVILQRQ